VPLCFGGETQKMVREDTDHGDKENILFQIIWAFPNPVKYGKGSGYSLQSFLKKNQKRISTAIPHAKPMAVKKNVSYTLSWPPKPDGTDAD
jgi:hypothetical protein